MSLDKKAILREIEVLIRSIKVHYDNIENEYRIPTIELELITSKIRKLHEKSIIYNHLHYLEEEQLQINRRNKFDQFIYKEVDEKNAAIPLKSDATSQEPEASKPSANDQIINNEKLSSKEDLPKPANTMLSESPTINQVEFVKEKMTEESKTPETRPLEISNSFKKVTLASKIGINDRFRFIKHLFGGNGAALEEAIKEIESCQDEKSVHDFIEKLKIQYQWDVEDETLMDFMQLLK